MFEDITLEFHGTHEIMPLYPGETPQRMIWRFKVPMAANLPEPIEIYSDDCIKVLCMDGQGAGGAHHLYHIYEADADFATAEPLGVIKHQEGPIAENGINGVNNEALLAIVGHRLECFQKGPFPSWFNQVALGGVNIAGATLFERTRDRQNRAVEGKSLP